MHVFQPRALITNVRVEKLFLQVAGRSDVFLFKFQ